MRSSVIAVLVHAALVVCGEAAQAPSPSDIRDAVAQEVEGPDASMSDFRTFETENLGTNTDPKIHTRIEFKVTPPGPLYSFVEKLGDVTVVALEKSSPTTVNAIAVSTLVKGRWVTNLIKVEVDHVNRGRLGASYGKFVIRGSSEHVALQQRIEKALKDMRPKFSGVWGWPAPYTRDGKPLFVAATGGCLYIRVAIPNDLELAGYAKVGFYDEFTSLPYVENIIPYTLASDGFLLGDSLPPADFTKVGLPRSHSGWNLSISPEGKLIIRAEQLNASLIPYDVATVKTERYAKQMAVRKLLTGVWKAAEGISFEGNAYIKRDAAAIRMTFVIKDGADWTGGVEIVLDSARGRTVFPGTFQIKDGDVTITEGRRGSIGRWPSRNITWHIAIDGTQMIAHAGQAKAVLNR